MPITYGPNLARSWGSTQLLGTVLMKSYMTHNEKSDVFLSYRHCDQPVALNLAEELDKTGLDVFIDFYDGNLDPADKNLDEALISAIKNSDTMVIIVSDETRESWWVPWEVGVSTPYGKPRAIYTSSLTEQLPIYLGRLYRIKDPAMVRFWVLMNQIQLMIEQNKENL